jgi:signal transduction histidine kinase
VPQTSNEIEITQSFVHSTLSAVTTTQNYQQLDLTAIIKASQAISGEIVLAQLIKKLLHLVIENAGAQRGLLILEKQGQLYVEAEAHAHQVNSDNEDILLQSIPLEALSEDEHSISIPIAVINYVVRTQNHLVLNNADQNDRFMNDPYIKRCQPKSILCLPLLNKGHLVGVLYLENNLINEAFTTERLNVLQWLSTQMAISIENAFIYAKLEQTREAAETANRAKSAFLMNMSHELRTPLNAILGYTDIIQEDAEDMGYENILLDLLKIQTAGKQLLGIISNVLDISKIEADKMGLNIEVFEVSQLLNEVVTVIQPSMGRNQLNIVPEKQLGTMRADRTKVQQILLNLLNNAIKFTSQGTITLKVHRYQNTDEQSTEDWLQFEIADTGIGMTVEQIEHVFEAFNQVDNSTTRQYGGTGLGLTISDRFCRMMGGKIIVNSQIGQGSTFTVQLPSRAIEVKN